MVEAGNATTPLRVGVIGGGTMGAGIAYAAACHGIEVLVAEIDPGRRAAVRGRIESDLRRDLDKGAIDGEGLAAALSRVQVVGSTGELAGHLDLVIEAVPEDAAAKRAVLAEAERLDCERLATNTSSISPGSLASALEHPERLVGLHFFNPVRQMALVEVVVAPQTAPELVEFGRDFATALGKQPLVVADSPGFLTSRLGVLLGLEAIRMLEQGIASADEIDAAMVLGYGHPLGPLRLTDLVGLDVRLAIARVLKDAYGERFAPPGLLVELVAEGRLGRKSGRGFFDWGD